MHITFVSDRERDIGIAAHLIFRGRCRPRLVEEKIMNTISTLGEKQYREPPVVILDINDLKDLCSGFITTVNILVGPARRCGIILVWVRKLRMNDPPNLSAIGGLSSYSVHDNVITGI